MDTRQPLALCRDVEIKQEFSSLGTDLHLQNSSMLIPAVPIQQQRYTLCLQNDLR